MSRSLEVPACITILLLPPYSPKLTPIERLFGCLRSRYLSNRAYDDYQHPLDDGAEAWRDLTPALLRSVRACDYLDITPEEGR
jgi:transposase